MGTKFTLLSQAQGSLLKRVQVWFSLIVSLGFIIVLAGCAAEPTRPEIPEFPEYAPTKKFLLLQQRRAEWAEENRAKRDAAHAQNLTIGRQKLYEKWEPIYRRVLNHSQNPPKETVKKVHRGALIHPANE